MSLNRGGVGGRKIGDKAAHVFSEFLICRRRFLSLVLWSFFLGFGPLLVGVRHGCSFFVLFSYSLLLSSRIRCQRSVTAMSCCEWIVSSLCMYRLVNEGCVVMLLKGGSL